ncbi:MAG: TonB-dependent receptor, partial [Verrucomicrobiota bacterium]
EVDFKKGPYYAEVGDFSSAGSAELHLFDELDAGVLKLGLGEDAFYRAVVADSVKTENGAWLGAFEYQHYDGPWSRPEDGKKFNGLAKFTLGDETGGLRLNAMGYHAEWNSTDQIARRAVRQGLVGRLGNLNPDNGGDTERYSLQVEGWNRQGGAETRGHAYVSYYNFNLWSDFTYFLSDPVNGDQFRQFDERVTVGGELVHERPGEWGGWSVDNAFGLQVRHDRISEVGLEQTRARRFVAPIRKDEVDETAVGLYVRNTTYWTDRLRSVFGLRGDAVFFDVDNEGFSENSGSENDQLLQPKLSVIYEVADRTELYVSGGMGYHRNDGRGTTTVTDPGTGESVRPVDPLVQSVGGEVGLRSTLLPGLQSTLSLWYLELDSELLFVGDAGTTEPSGKTERFGVEWANFYEANDWLTFDLDLAWVDAKLSDEPSGADEIPGAIPLVLAAGASVDFENGLFGSLRLRHFDSYPLVEDDSVEAGSTSLVNLQVGYRWKKHDTSIHLDVLNLFDSEDNDIEYFYESRLAGEPAVGVEDVHFHPVEPRTLRVYLKKTF